VLQENAVSSVNHQIFSV